MWGHLGCGGSEAQAQIMGTGTLGQRQAGSTGKAGVAGEGCREELTQAGHTAGQIQEHQEGVQDVPDSSATLTAGCMCEMWQRASRRVSLSKQSGKRCG